MSVLCIAHRGARREAPENTWSAFDKAMAYPIDGIELDVQMSADGVPFLFHDDTLWRVTRSRKRVAHMAIGELVAMDWGRWFNPAYQGESLMTFESLLFKLDRCPRWLIEIKSSPKDQSSGHAYRLAEKVVGMIKKMASANITERLMVLCFDPKVLAFAYNLAPEIKYVLNLKGKEPISTLDTLPVSPQQLWGVDVNIARMNHDHVRWARTRQLKLFTYTVNGPRQLKKALDGGVDGIISDRPGWLTDTIKGES